MRKRIVSKIYLEVFLIILKEIQKITNYKKSLQVLCKVDGVICSSNEQRKEIYKFNKNCHIFFEVIFIFLTLI